MGGERGPGLLPGKRQLAGWTLLRVGQITLSYALVPTTADQEAIQTLDLQIPPRGGGRYMGGRCARGEGG